jgi:hypothetical protein
MDDYLANNNDIFGLRRRRDNVIFVENALIEGINRDNRTTYVTISYEVMDNNCITNMNVVTLVVSRNTIIRDQFGQPMSVADLREGIVIDAEFSSAMTRSIPPQSNAYRITVISQNNSFSVTEDTVIGVDPSNNFLFTGNPYDIYDQMRFVVNESTVIRDRRGNRIRLTDLRPGQDVRVEHAIFQTASIPPQTTAFSIQVI